ncbi:hypothetical protein ACQP1K_09795 [Sphaerimonospora sp. CA-214678]
MTEPHPADIAVIAMLIKEPYDLFDKSDNLAKTVRDQLGRING